MHVLCFSHPARQRPESSEHVDAGPQDCDERQLHCLVDTDDENGHALTLGSHEGTSLHSFEEHEALMSEIQLRGIVDKMTREASSQGTDGAEVMTKNGTVISKFFKGALEIGAVVGVVILDKVEGLRPQLGG
jgi:hypothetical protein